MHIVRKLLLILITPVLSLLLFALALDVGVTRLLVHPKMVKQIVSDSGVYSTIIPSLLDQQGKQNSGSGDISLTDPAVKSAATAAFSPQLLQTSTENIIDGVYHWLDGKVATPDFKIDLSSTKTTFANQVAQAAANRAITLPRCTSLPANTSFDAFSANIIFHQSNHP